MRIYTLGAADRSEAELVKILSKYQIQVLVDIRRTATPAPPHLARGNIQKLCQENRVEYLYLGNELSAERETGRINALDSTFYDRGIAILKSLARTRGLLIFCSERTPESCNRKTIAEILAKDGAEVYHLVGVEELWRPAPRHDKPKKHWKPRYRKERRGPKPKEDPRRGPPFKKKTGGFKTGRPY